MIVSVASGKGGTGKTTVAVNLALSIPEARLLDCDVEEPNAHLFIRPEWKGREIVSIPVPQVNAALCRLCGKCQEVCAFNAIAVVGEKVLVFPELCHGCGACSYLCPQKAIQETGREAGVVETGHRDGQAFVRGTMALGQTLAPPVIRSVKTHIDPGGINIIDAPPGTSCPVIEAMKGSDFCLLVTEPTPFGLHDLKLAVATVKKLAIPAGVIINRCDLGDDQTEIFCRKEEVPVLMKIPFQREIAEAYSSGIPLIEKFGEYRERFRALWAQIERIVREKAAPA